MSIVVALGTFESSDRLGEALIRGVRGVRIRCRRCGAFIDVLNRRCPRHFSQGRESREPGKSHE